MATEYGLSSMSQPTPNNTPLVNAEPVKEKQVLSSAGSKVALSAFETALSYIPIVGPVLSTLAGAVGDHFINRSEQKKAENRANVEYDRRLAEERAYNDPSAVAARLRAAGINPMAAYGNIASGTSASNMSAPSLSSVAGTSNIGGAVGNALSSMSGLIRAQSDVAKTQSEVELNTEYRISEHFKRILMSSQSQSEDSQARYTDTLTAYNKAVFEPSVENAYLALEKVATEIRLADQSTEESRYRCANLFSETTLTLSMAEHEGVKMQETRSRISLNYANIDKIEREMQSMDVEDWYRRFTALSQDEQWRSSLAQNEFLETGWMELEERMQQTQIDWQKKEQSRQFWFDLARDIVGYGNSHLMQNKQNSFDRSQSRSRSNDKKVSEFTSLASKIALVYLSNGALKF